MPGPVACSCSVRPDRGSRLRQGPGHGDGRPTLILDIGSLMGSLIGQTEERTRQALRIADAMAPCMIMIDELERALSGVGSTGDSGVSSRMFGKLLTYLSDHKSDVFIVASANDISKLPPEFARAERFDGVFFLDLPGPNERRRSGPCTSGSSGWTGTSVGRRTGTGSVLRSGRAAA